MAITGDPAPAPRPALRPLAALLADLARFEHPSLRPYAPASYALQRARGHAPGGCRAVDTVRSPAAGERVRRPRVVPADEARRDWPTGANAGVGVRWAAARRYG